MFGLLFTPFVKRNGKIFRVIYIPLRIKMKSYRTSIQPHRMLVDAIFMWMVKRCRQRNYHVCCCSSRMRYINFHSHCIWLVLYTLLFR